MNEIQKVDFVADAMKVIQYPQAGGIFREAILRWSGDRKYQTGLRNKVWGILKEIFPDWMPEFNDSLKNRATILIEHVIAHYYKSVTGEDFNTELFRSSYEHCFNLGEYPPPQPIPPPGAHKSGKIPLNTREVIINMGAIDFAEVEARVAAVTSNYKISNGANHVDVGKEIQVMTLDDYEQLRQQLSVKESNNMDYKQPAVEDRKFIFGKPASEISSEEIWDIIRDLEYKLKTLKAIENKPDSLKAEIAKIKAQIKELVLFENSK